MGTRIRLDTTALHPEAQRLKDFLESRLISQRRAVNSVVIAYNRFLSPLRLNETPILAMLSMGPSGSGKTYLAELVAEYFFGKKMDLTKIACADYAEQHQVSKLIGAPPGYLGHKDPPRLAPQFIYAPAIRYHTEHNPEIIRISNEMDELASHFGESEDPEEQRRLLKQVKKKGLEIARLIDKAITDSQYPAGVLLFDEVEKGHTALMNFLLEVTGCGKATLGEGTLIDLTKFFIIMTSNVASSEIARTAQGTASIGFQTSPMVREMTDQAIYQTARAAAKSRFPIELINRVRMVVYRILSVPELRTIIEREISDLQELLYDRGFLVQIKVSDAVRNLILRESAEHPEKGAREVIEKVKTYLKDPLDGAIAAGGVEQASLAWIIFELEGTPEDPTVVLYREDDIVEILETP